MATIVTDFRDTQFKNGSVDAMSREESLSFFNASAQRYLGITGDEFLRRWDSGYFTGPELDTRATMVAMLIPMVRPKVARKKSR
ncbi:MAG: hypothetical protein ACLGSH_08430 [Acidobacteriota bacterium]